MSETQYTYAVARIRSKEMQMLGTSVIEQLLAAKSYEECLRLLAEKGWGDDSSDDVEAMLAAEREKTWSLIGELVEDMHIFDVFLYANDYHNLKAAIKLVCTATEDFGVFIAQSSIDHKLIFDAVQEHDFTRLPPAMQEPAEQAYTALSQTRDGQLCDIIIDRAALEAIYRAGMQADNDLIRKYAELTVAAADIKIAVRCNLTGKPLDFIRRALAPCASLDVQRLAQAAAENMDAVYDCLSTTNYADAVPALQESPFAFERWCDNLLIENIRPQQFNPFGLGPLAAYILGRENEIKVVRILLSGKRSGLAESAIRERMRVMYV